MGDDWANQFAGRIIQKQQDAKNADDLLMRKRGMISSQAQLLWDDLRRTINDKAKGVNTAGRAEYFKCAPLIEHRMDHSVQSPAGHTGFTFSPEVPNIRFRFTKAHKDPRVADKTVESELTFQVFDEAGWFTDKNGERMNVSSAAEFVLEMHF